MNHIHNIARGINIKNDSILLAFHKKHKYYFLPGGHIEIGESARRALVRECKEEMGLDIMSKDFITTLENSFDNNGRIQHEYTIIFSFDISENQELVSQVDHLEFIYVPLSEFGSINFLPSAIISTINSFYSNKQLEPFISTLH